MDEKEYKRQIRDLARMLYAYLKEHCVAGNSQPALWLERQ